MARKTDKTPKAAETPEHYGKPAQPAGKPSALIDTRVIYCGDNLEQLAKLPDACVDLIYIDPPFNSNRNYEVFWGETKEKRAFEDRHASTAGLHRLHAPALRRTRPRPQEDRLLLLPLRLARLPLRQGHARSDFRGEQFPERDHLEAHIGAQRRRQGSKHSADDHDTIFFYTGGDEYTWNQQYQPVRPRVHRDSTTAHVDDGRAALSDWTT